ncbi:MAG: hypothetical protein IPG11_17550 [Flavobacteriales bacterium]|nr:hypothetical protein [Flavobacteriales bacterium]
MRSATGCWCIARTSKRSNFAQPLRDDIGCIFIDPPYNTTEESFVYKNDYKHGSWMTMMSNRLTVAKGLMKEEAVLGVSIDDEEA